MSISKDFMPFSRSDIIGGAEGKVITSRPLKTYETYLMFNRSLLKGQRVLNLGSGGSNLSGEIQRANIDAAVVDLDLAPDPTNQYVQLLNPIFKVANTFLPADNKFRRSLVDLKRTLARTKDRQFVQGNGRVLPFDSDSFDTVFALFSTYQIPAEAKRQVLSELLRVGKALHIGPVMSGDFDILEELSTQFGYDIIYSRALKTPRSEDIHVAYPDDYATYAQKYPYTYRVRRPIHDHPTMMKAFGLSLGADVNGNMVVMRKKQSPNMGTIR